MIALTAAMGAALVCTGFTGPGTETCNGADDDCDGTTDNVPGSGTSCCTSGKCASANQGPENQAGVGTGVGKAAGVGQRSAGSVAAGVGQ